MRYNEPKITWLTCIEEPLMASPENGGGNGGNSTWPGGEIELPPIPMG